MKELVEKILSIGVGALSLTEQKVHELADDLIHRGELRREQGEGFIKDVLDKAEKSREQIEEQITNISKKTMNKLNIATSDKLAELERRIAALEEKVEK